MEYTICFCFIIKSFTIKGKHYLYRCLCELISENWTWSNSVTVPRHRVSGCRVSPVGSDLYVLQGFGTCFWEVPVSTLQYFSCAKAVLLLKVHASYCFRSRIMRSSFYNPKCGVLNDHVSFSLFFLPKKYLPSFHSSKIQCVTSTG